MMMMMTRKHTKDRKVALFAMCVCEIFLHVDEWPQPSLYFVCVPRCFVECVQGIFPFFFARSLIHFVVIIFLEIYITFLTLLEKETRCLVTHTHTHIGFFIQKNVELQLGPLSMYTGRAAEMAFFDVYSHGNILNKISSSSHT